MLRQTQTQAQAQAQAQARAVTTFTPVDNKKHEYLISDAVHGSEDVDHVIIKIDAFENGSWKTKGTAVEYRPADCTSGFPPI